MYSPSVDRTRLGRKVNKKFLSCFNAAILCLQAATVLAQGLDRTAQLEARKELASIGIQFSPNAWIDAVKNRDSLAMSLLLEAGMDVNTSVDGQTGLMVAVVSGAHEMIGLLLEEGADITVTDRQGNTVLHAARDAEAISLLVESGANVNAQSRAGETALWRAVVKNQNGPLAKALLDAGATPDLTPENEAPALAYAVERQDAGLVRMLLDNGATADVPARRWPGEPNLYWGSWRGERPLGTPTYWEGSLLSKAVYEDNTATAKVLLDFGASPNSIAWHRDRETHRVQDINGEQTTYKFTYSSKSTPFMLAVQRERLALAERMLIAGSNANAIFHDRFVFPNGEEQSVAYSPLSKAVPTGNVEMVALLLEHGADPNAVSCVLHTAARRSHPDVLRLLIKAGADVDEICPVWRQTALQVAIDDPPSGKTHRDAWTSYELTARQEIVEALINGGADVNKSSRDWLPIHGAVSGFFGSDARNLELLIGAGANANAIGPQGTPLHIAVDPNGTVHNRVAQVQVLINSCIDLEVEHIGQTAIEEARHWSNYYDEYREIYDLLRGGKRRQRQLGCE